MSLLEPELITIVEGPPPEFQMPHEGWPFSLWEGAKSHAVALAQMRTFSGPAMLERCIRAWDDARPVMLDFPQGDGLRKQVEVLAARVTQVDEGDVLNLWVALPFDEIEGPDFVFDEIDDEMDDDEDDDPLGYF